MHIQKTRNTSITLVISKARAKITNKQILRESEKMSIKDER